MSNPGLNIYPFLAFLSPGPGEMLAIAVVALLLFGGKLPEVARSWGRSFAEFRRSLSGIQNEINDALYSEPDLLEYRDDTTIEQGYRDDEADEPTIDAPTADPNPDPDRSTSKDGPVD